MFEEMRFCVSRRSRQAMVWIARAALSLVSIKINRRSAFFLTLFLVIGIGLVGSQASAQGLDEKAAIWVLSLIGQFLNILIHFLFSILILLIDVLIWFASYNDFVKSQPVTIGWVLVRDIVNMFFIVVLLASAFATIIQYKALHYSQVLPKLLLMAILINFSKTLIGLLIDFSQVIMLTFVNAFRQAAAGNFVTALKLDKMTALDPNKTDVYELTKLIIAAILAIVMLSLALTVVVIMVAYLVGRIVTLWILLIMSPIAFFATALPGNLAKSLSVFTGKFWGRLSTALTGGPIMAFFLWLTLAIAQGSQKPFAEITGGEVDSAFQVGDFSTIIGSAGEIATFIVALAIMMQGVEFAVSTANEISHTIGSFAKRVSSGGGIGLQALRLGARTGVGAARVGARVTGKAAGLGFEGIDRLADVRGKVGAIGLKASGALGGIGAATFAGMSAYRGKKIKEKQEELAKITGLLDTSSRDAYLRSRADSVFGREAAAAKLALADSATDPLKQKKFTEKYLEQLKAEAGYDKLSKEEQAKQEPNLRAKAELMALQQRAEDLKAGKKAAEEIGNEEKAGKYKKVFKEEVALNRDWEGLSDIKNASVEDPKKFLGDVSADAVKDSATFLAYASALGLVDADGNFAKRDGDKKEVWDMLLKGKRGDYVNKHLEMLENNPNKVKDQLDAIGGNAEAAKRADTFRHYVTSNQYGHFGGIAVKDALGGGVTVAAGPTNQTVNFQPQNEVVIREAEAQLDVLKARGAKADDVEARTLKMAMVGAGASLERAFKFDAATGVFRDQDNRNSFVQGMDQLTRDAASGDQGALDALAHLDTKSLRANPDTYNDARATLISQLDPERLKRSYDEAIKANNEEAKGKLQELLKIVETEAERTRKLTASAGVSLNDLRQAASDPTGAGRGVITRLQNAGIPDANTAFAAARAEVLHAAVSSDPQLRAIRGNTSDRISTAGLAMGAAASSAASATGGAIASAARGAASAAKGAAEAAEVAAWRARGAVGQAQRIKRETGKGYTSQAASGVRGALRSRRSSPPPPPPDTSL